MTFYEALDNILDSKDVNVGGGSASAIAAAMAAGLVGMVARLSFAKKDKTYGLNDEEYQNCADELDKLMEELKKGAVDDANAYLSIKNAYTLPKETEEQKTVRRTAVEDAAVIAATVPLKNAKRAVKILEWARKLDGYSNSNAASDLNCGKMLATMAVRGAIFNVAANLSLIKIQSKKEVIEKELVKLQPVICSTALGEHLGGNIS